MSERQPYSPTEWVTGDLITAERVNHIEQGIKNIEDDIYTGEGNLADQVKTMIEVSDTQPESSYNKLWVKSTNEEGVLIPTASELDDVSNIIAEAFSTTKAYEIGDYVIHDTGDGRKLYRFISAHTAGAWNGGQTVRVTVEDEIETIPRIVIDNTLSMSGKAADAKATGDAIAAAVIDVNADIADAKNATIYSVGNGAITITEEGKYLSIASNVVDVEHPQTSSSGYGYVIVPCEAGDCFEVSGVSSNNYPLAWVFTDSSYTILTKAVANATITNAKVVAPYGSAYLIIHDKTPYRASYSGKILANVAKDIGIINDVLLTKSKNLFNPKTTEQIKGGYYTQYGVWTPSTTHNTLIISCRPNEQIYRTYPSGYNSVAQNEIAFFDVDRNFVSGYKATSGATYFTVPNIASIRFAAFPIESTFYTANGTYKYGVVSNSPISAFSEYGANAYSPRLDTIESFNDMHWSGKTWYAYGTSLTSTSQGKYAQYVAQFSGLTLYNKGIPGGGLVANRNVYNALNDLTDGKVDADLITIEVGANDWNVPLGDISGSDTDTFCGALNHCLQTILMNCPKAQVVLMCSTRQRKSDDGTTLSPLDAENSYGVTYEEKNEAIRKVAVANGIYYIPFGSGLGLGLYRQQSSDLYNVDQIHHTALGGYNLAKGVWSYLKNIPLWYNSLPS